MKEMIKTWIFKWVKTGEMIELRKVKNMLPQIFKEKWDEKKDGPLIQLDENKLKNTPFSFEIKQFLTVSGLPETPPPYLEFTALAEHLRPMNPEV